MKIAELIEILSGWRNEEIYSQICTVKSVDSVSRTCVCSPVNGDGDLHSVLLQAVDGGTAGIVITPKVGSFVIVTFISKELVYVALTAECDKIEITSGEIVFNDGSKGGLVVSADVAGKLNALESDLNSLKTAFSSWVVVPSDGGAALKAITATWAAQQLTSTNATELENSTIKHG
ncbi:hypothetical protein SDC9_115657 [bioreactor metagenome]|uniref:Uncharacterized protein n=1 Tax=bioreactor metagenome TaxID=1076179 RepID=A0A645C071_9ZZZZ